MKLSIKILVGMFVVFIVGLLASNIILKGEYDKVDKSDLYWTYRKILEQPFKYLKIEGGNITHIAFEQSLNSSVRVSNNWLRENEGVVKASVKNDTLFILFNYAGKTMDEKGWWKYITPVRIFSPELMAVEGFDTNLEMFKLNQKSINVSMSGKSKFEVESRIRHLDSLNIFQKDSSEVVFEMSPDNKLSETQVVKKGVALSTNSNKPIVIDAEEIKSPEAMNIQYVKANLQGYALLDLGHAQINSINLNIADSSAIILSGGAIKRLPK
ncbi:MAG TPA: hypothetical protein VII44_09740 [Puia sp.]